MAAKNMQTYPLAVDVAEAGRMIGLGKTSVYNLIGRNELRTIMLGGRRLVPISALRELVDNAGPGAN